MEVAQGHTLTGTLTKNIHHEIRGPKKSMQKLGLAVDTGIGRPGPFFGPRFEPLFALFLEKVRARRRW